MGNNKVYYKVLDKDMKSPLTKFQYELGKTYSTNEEIKLCENGFHACKNMYEMPIHTYRCNKLKDYRFFECTLGDTVIEVKHTVVSDSITLTKEIPFEEVDRSIRENLDVLVNDKDWPVREAVAREGYALDIFIHDKNWSVREAVARQGYGLDILVHDKEYFVREEARKAMSEK